MKHILRIIMMAGVCHCSLFSFTLDNVKELAMETWTTLDKVRAIAEEDRPLLEDDLCATQLELYTAVASLHKYNKAILEKDDNVLEVDLILRLIEEGNIVDGKKPLACSSKVFAHTTHVWSAILQKLETPINGDPK